jgi:hypothetical protein
MNINQIMSAVKTLGASPSHIWPYPLSSPKSLLLVDRLFAPIDGI